MVVFAIHWHESATVSTLVFFFWHFFFFFNFCLRRLRCVWELSLVAERRGYSQLQYEGLSLQWLLPLQSIGSITCRLESLQPDSVVGAHHPSWRASLVAQMVKSVCLQCGKPSSFPGSGRSPGEGNGNLHQYPCLGHPTDRGAWRATVHGVAKRLRHDSD